MIKEGLYWTGGNNRIYIQNKTIDWITKHSVPVTWSQEVTYTYQRYKGLSYDYRNRHIVISDEGTKTINVLRIDNYGSVKDEVLHVGTSSRVGHVAVDWLSGNIYWADDAFELIGLQVIPNSIYPITLNDKIVVDRYLDIPFGITVHPQKGFLFWSDIGTPARIERSNLDGSSRMALIWLGINRPISLAVDHANNNLYWVDSVRSTVESCDFYGNKRRMLVTSFTSQIYGNDIYKNYVLFSDQATNEIALYSVNGITVNTLVKTPDKPFSIAMFTSENQQMTSDSCRTKGCKDICITTITGAKCMCRNGYSLGQDGLTCTVDIHFMDKSLLISSASRVCFYPVTAINSYLHLQKGQKCGTTLNDNFEIDFIAPDTFRKTLSIASKKSPFIYQQKINDVHRRIFEGSSNINGLFFDWTTSELYWTEQNGGNIYRSVIESNLKFIISIYRQLFNSILVSPRSITLDPLKRRIFWVAGSQHPAILNQNQMSVVTLVHTGLSSPYGLTFSRRLNRLFWTDMGRIGSVSSDGTDIQLSNGTNCLSYFGITTYKYFVLWLSKSSAGVYINVEDLSDESSPKRSAYKLSLATEIQIFDNSEQPQINEPCVYKNGGCEHICIVENIKSRCECEVGYKLHSDRKSCISSNFLCIFI
ncbi:hypothetical protein KUTeg_012136 [Tegillarca granosa]|uniref:EGF-like domain-containing protein n=1 Tax=Tegillarca granosa TaxID=220873 RepID=A0ABQ9F238_TEGGR|nr:hypothetical protein KUTeg_012136 [Tegillarca granosa]